MPRIDSEKFYHSSIKKHGTSPQGVHWLCKNNQDLRFEAICEMLPEKVDSLVDAGCGFGDFYHFIQNHTIELEKYTGIDSLQTMCDKAIENTHQEILLADITKDKIPYAEYYVCSGALNLLHRFETYLFIANCYKKSQKAFVFNVLYGNKKSDTYNYMNKEDILDIATQLKVSKTVFTEGYLKDDITVGFFV